MTAALHTGRRAGLLRAAELLALGGPHRTLAEMQARGLLPVAA